MWTCKYNQEIVVIVSLPTIPTVLQQRVDAPFHGQATQLVRVMIKIWEIPQSVIRSQRRKQTHLFVRNLVAIV